MRFPEFIALLKKLGVPDDHPDPEVILNEEKLVTAFYDKDTNQLFLFNIILEPPVEDDLTEPE